MLTVPAPRKRVLMGVNGNINVRSLHSRALVLHNADSYALNVQNRAIRKDRLIRRHGYARLYRLAAGCDSVTLSADMRVLLCAIGRAKKHSCIFQLNLSVGQSIKAKLHRIYNLFVLYCPVDPVLRPACVNVPLRFKVSDPAFQHTSLCTVDDFSGTDQS